MSEWPFGTLKRQHYRCLYLDPPWAFTAYSARGLKKSPQAHYGCMTLADIQALPVRELAHPEGCALVIWATAPLLPEALETMSCWGFTFKSAGAWAKQSATGRKWAFGTGYLFRSAAEFFLLGTRGRIASRVRDVRNLVVAPVREHSRKPDQLRADLERMFEGPRAELFARWPGNAEWDVFGNDTQKFGAAA